MQELAPTFEAVLMPHDGNVEALAKLSSKTLLPVDVASKVLVTSQKYPYRQLKAADGKPYTQTVVDGALKRFYIFANPDDINDTASLLALQCNVTLDKSGIILVMPEALLRGADADVALSVKFGCCASGGRTMLYSDRKADGSVFLRIAFSGADVRGEIQNVWRNLKLVSLDAKGVAALKHLADDMTGQCQGHAHTGKPDYSRASSWAGPRVAMS